ncbi:DUF4389 domain-containing protein [Microbulbifer yueqingensis]|uniref:DUF4389 domain-containing protein n=1 Tax=Microbulbifer yueqingensis TaxID=658219 RepID=A0A1G8V5S6_9GAMM|nr:DUF4389 domain-containing protein [Microbulbifer yueqingensis]SDJ61486.1 protein of unknown function [Microbulbifer yueqingensis]
MDNEELKDNLTSGNHWMRLLYMVLFVVLLEIAGFVMLAVVILQFLFSIFTGEPNGNLRRLGDQIASYVYQTLQFLVYNTEEKPFPFAEWPESDVEDLSGYESAEEVEGEVVSEGKAGHEDVPREEKSKGAGAYVPVELGTEGEYEEEREEEKSGKSSSAKSTSAKSSASSATKGNGSKGNGSKRNGSKSASAKGSSGKSSSSDSSSKSTATESSAGKDTARDDDNEK